MSASDAAEFVEGDCIVNVHPDSRFVAGSVETIRPSADRDAAPAAALEMRLAFDGVK